MVIVESEVSKNLKEESNRILENLGLNMSTYINMALNQLVIQEGIPFIEKLNSPYTEEEKINEVAATLSIEDMELDEKDIEILKSIQSGKISTEKARLKIFEEI